MGTEQIPLPFTRYSEQEMQQRAEAFHDRMAERRSIRHFSDEPVPFAVIQAVVRTASTAPSGAHKQPWTFCVISDPVIKKRIRQAAEEEEYANYHGRMPQEWLDDLEPFATDHVKTFLETAPYLIVVFKRAYEVEANGTKKNNYYVTESVGLATGMLLAAAHMAGLATLTHTPSPMNFLSTVLRRPSNERPFLLIPMGYPASDCRVPKLERKPLEQVMEVYGSERALIR